MMTSFIRRDTLPDLLSQFAKQAALYAPVRADGVVAFAPVESGAQVCWEYSNSVVPPKALLFPQTEPLFRYSPSDAAQIETPAPPLPTIIFGVRPCDAKGYVILDQVFGGAIPDVYYMPRRRAATIIGLSCAQPCGNGFCASVNGGPAASEGMDIRLTPVDGGYVADVLTDNGRALFATIHQNLHPATDAQREQQAVVARDAAQRIARSVDTRPFPEKLDGLFEHAIWRELSQACVGCGICAFLCPTCHCFDIRDEAGIHEGRRVRVWDTCSNPEYTQHASGHNPRPGRLHRLRNRIFHKFSYHPQRFGEFACVGCGRCISRCPVNLDLIDILTTIAAL
jgi:sulfhydrogenase subunit beta (sulfur reductase)